MRKLVAFLLCMALCLSLGTVPASAASADTADTSAAVLNMMGALQGDGSGSLQLDGTLTRAQFCKMAVVVMGLAKNAGQYAGYTIFPDVPSGGWEAGYVNLAVRSAGIMTGYPNGKFGPNDIITYGQAVTVLMKMLGYATADVGYNWPDSFISKAGEVGLTDGVNLSAGAPISRGSAAVLFVNLLNAEMNGSSKKFMETISGATVLSGVFLVSSDATTDDGTDGAVRIAGAADGTYLPAADVPDALVGAYGALVLNASGKALAFVPAATGKTVVSTVSEATSSYIKCSDGTQITLTGSTAFYLNGTAQTYGGSWVDIRGGMLVSAYYSDGGSLLYLLVSGTEANTGSLMVVTTDTYTLPAQAVVYINGNKAASADIEKYDVVSGNGAGVYNVTRSRITGRYEDASPGTGTPDTVTVLGTEFPVLDSASSALSSFKIGDVVTLLLTSDGKVAGAAAGTAAGTTNYGVVTSLTSSGASVRLANGITVTGTTSNTSSDVYSGSLVSVSSASEGCISLYAVTVNPGGSLNIAAGTMGSLSLSKAVAVYECVGGSTVSEIKLSDIRTAAVDSTKVRYYATDYAGDVSLLLLDDVTGNAYTYGFIENGSVTDKSASLSATNPTTSVTNSNGTTTAVLGTTNLAAGTPAGIAATGGGVLAGYATLTAVSGVSRSSFQQDDDGVWYVKVSGGLIEVSGDVQCYIDSTSTWTTLVKARSSSDNMTLYYDKTPSTGGKIRIIIAR